MSNKVEEGSKLKIEHWNSKNDPYHCEVCNGRKHKENQMGNKNYKDKIEYKFHCEVCDVYIFKLRKLMMSILLDKNIKRNCKINSES